MKDSLLTPRQTDFRQTESQTDFSHKSMVLTHEGKVQKEVREFKDGCDAEKCLSWNFIIQNT